MAAIPFYDKAAQQGDVKSIAKLALVQLAVSWGLKKWRQRVCQTYLRSAALAGHPSSLRKYVILQCVDDNELSEEGMRFLWGNKTDIIASYLYGSLALDTAREREDGAELLSAALEYFLSAMRSGSICAIAELGSFFLDEGFAEAGVACLSWAARWGDVESFIELRDWYGKSGISFVPVDSKAFLRNAERLAWDLKDPDAAKFVMESYLLGVRSVCLVDVVVALRLWRWCIVLGMTELPERFSYFGETLFGDIGDRWGIAHLLCCEFFRFDGFKFEFVQSPIGGGGAAG